MTSTNFGAGEALNRPRDPSTGRLARDQANPGPIARFHLREAAGTQVPILRGRHLLARALVAAPGDAVHEAAGDRLLSPPISLLQQAAITVKCTDGAGNGF